jgi:hypothetical protein
MITGPPPKFHGTRDILSKPQRSGEFLRGRKCKRPEALYCAKIVVEPV